MSNPSKLTGGCMCQAVRYDITGEPMMVSHCHCHSCRKHNGAAMVTLAGFKAEQVEFRGTARKVYTSSPGVGRGFCPECGTPLTWEGDGGEIGPIFELHISTFDEPDALVPTCHAFYPERIAWFDTVDQLPRYQGFPEESLILRHTPADEGTPT